MVSPVFLNVLHRPCHSASPICYFRFSSLSVLSCQHLMVTHYFLNHLTENLLRTVRNKCSKSSRFQPSFWEGVDEHHHLLTSQTRKYAYPWHWVCNLWIGHASLLEWCIQIQGYETGLDKYCTKKLGLQIVKTFTASKLGCSVCMASHKVCFVISSVQWITWFNKWKTLVEQKQTNWVDFQDCM